MTATASTIYEFEILGENDRQELARQHVEAVNKSLAERNITIDEIPLVILAALELPRDIRKNGTIFSDKRNTSELNQLVAP